MLKYSITKHLPIYKSSKLYDIVIDIPSYKTYIPFCKDSYISDDSILLKNKQYSQSKVDISILNSSIKEIIYEKSNIKEAYLKVGYGKVFNFSYPSIVISDSSNIYSNGYGSGNSSHSNTRYILSIANDNNIFSNLYSLWVFKYSNDYKSCQVEYSILFNFKNKFYSSFAEIILKGLGESMVDAFLNKVDVDLAVQSKDELQFLLGFLQNEVITIDEYNFIIRNLYDSIVYKEKIGFYRRNYIDNKEFIDIMKKDILNLYVIYYIYLYTIYYIKKLNSPHYHLTQHHHNNHFHHSHFSQSSEEAYSVMKRINSQ